VVLPASRPEPTRWVRGRLESPAVLAYLSLREPTMSARLAPSLLVLITLMVGVDLAAADVVSPPPTDCPPGTSAVTNHAGPHCLPAACDDGKPCPSAQVCAIQQLCLVERVFTNRTGDHHAEVVSGPCQRGQCSEGTCRSERVCMAEAVATGGRPGKVVATSPGRPAETGGGSAESLVTRQEPVPVDVPRPAPAGCRGVATVGAAVGGVMVALLATIAFLLRRRRTHPHAASKRTSRRT
jgi:hypothetical protein